MRRRTIGNMMGQPAASPPTPGEVIRFHELYVLDAEYVQAGWSFSTNTGTAGTNEWLILVFHGIHDSQTINRTITVDGSITAVELVADDIDNFSTLYVVAVEHTGGVRTFSGEAMVDTPYNAAVAFYVVTQGVVDASSLVYEESTASADGACSVTTSNVSGLLAVETVRNNTVGMTFTPKNYDNLDIYTSDRIGGYHDDQVAAGTHTIPGQKSLTTTGAILLAFDQQ